MSRRPSRFIAFVLCVLTWAAPLETSAQLAAPAPEAPAGAAPDSAIPEILEVPAAPLAVGLTPNALPEPPGGSLSILPLALPPALSRRAVAAGVRPTGHIRAVFRGGSFSHGLSRRHFLASTLGRPHPNGDPKRHFLAGWLGRTSSSEDSVGRTQATFGSGTSSSEDSVGATSAWSSLFDGSASSGLRILEGGPGPSRLSEFSRLLPDKGRNRLLWVWLIGSSVYTFGNQFHVVALPGLVAPRPELSNQMGVVRTAHWTTQAGASLVAEPWLDRTSVRRLLILAGFAEATVVATVPLVSLAGLGWAFAPLLGVMILRSLSQALGWNASQVCFRKILGESQQAYNKVNAVSTVLYGLVGTAGGYVAGLLITYVSGLSRVSLGVSVAYGVYSLMTFASTLIYLRFLESPELSGPTARPPADPGLGQALKDRLGDYWKGLKLVFVQERFIGFSLLFTTIQLLATDALIFIVLPHYLMSMHGGAGSFGALMGIGSLGSMLGALGMMFADRGSSSEPSDGKRLENQGKMAYFLSALGTAFFTGIYFSHAVWLAALFYFLFSLFTAPLSIVWSSLIQKVLSGDRENIGKAVAFINFYTPVVSAGGTFFLGRLVSSMAVPVAMLLFAVLMLGDSVLHVIAPLVLFPLNRPKAARPAPPAPDAPPGPKTAFFFASPAPAWA